MSSAPQALIVTLAMADLDTYFDSQWQRITTRMALEVEPLKQWNPWVKEKLLQSENKEYWMDVFRTTPTL